MFWANWLVELFPLAGQNFFYLLLVDLEYVFLWTVAELFWSSVCISPEWEFFHNMKSMRRLFPYWEVDLIFIKLRDFFF